MSAGKSHVLYVDDEDSNLRIFKTTFKRNYKVHIALTISEAFNILDNQPISLIIADQKMPEMTGVEFLSQVILKNPAPVRMILTGYSDLEAVIKAINAAQVYKYATKPWNRDELHKMLEEALNYYQESKKLRLALDNANRRISELEKQLLQQS